MVHLIFYSGPDGTSKIDVIMQDHTCWMSQKRIAEVFGVDVRTINEHINQIDKYD
jgi:hypothetical protein